LLHTDLVFTGSTSGQSGGNIDHRPLFWCSYNLDSYISGRDFRTAGNVWAGSGQTHVAELANQSSSFAGRFESSSGFAKLGMTEQTGFFKRGNIEVKIGTSDKAAELTDGSITTTFCKPSGEGVLVDSGNISIETNGDFVHKGNTGATVASQLSGGINYGATNEVQVKNLQPDDYVLVRR